MTDKPTPTDAATPECLSGKTVSDEVVGEAAGKPIKSCAS